MYRSTIEKEEIANLPKLSYNGKIEIISTMEGLGRAISVLEKEKLIGFDTEAKPSFVKGKETNKVALMQLCTSKTCFLIRLNKLGIPSALSDLMANPTIQKVGISLKDDFHSLQKMQKITLNAFIDLQTIISNYGIEEKSLQKIYAILFGKRISKSQRLSNWEAEILTPAQQEYAAIDASACLEIYKKLLTQ